MNSVTAANFSNVYSANRVGVSFKGKTNATAPMTSAKGTEFSPAFMGRDLVNQVKFLKAGEAFEGKSYDVQAVGNGKTPLDLVTKENVAEYSKYPDIWYQGGKEAAEEAVAKGEKDPRYLHPHVGGTMQFYGLTPMSDDYVTKDPETIQYCRENGFTAFNEKGEECFVNAYNGDRDFIESTYTDDDGNLLKDVGGVTGKTEATQCKEMKVVLLPVGSKVKPVNDENMRTVGVGDVVCCSAKKRKGKNDLYVKSVNEFLKTAKKNDDFGNTEFITALEEYAALGRRDASAWNKVMKKYGNR
jgi:hypothetical protein